MDMEVSSSPQAGVGRNRTSYLELARLVSLTEDKENMLFANATAGGVSSVRPPAAAASGPTSLQSQPSTDGSELPPTSAYAAHPAPGQTRAVKPLLSLHEVCSLQIRAHLLLDNLKFLALRYLLHKPYFLFLRRLLELNMTAPNPTASPVTLSSSKLYLSYPLAGKYAEPVAAQVTAFLLPLFFNFCFHVDRRFRYASRLFAPFSSHYLTIAFINCSRD